MKQRTWKVGLCSKIILTVIAVSLVGLLVKQFPEKLEANSYVSPGGRTPNRFLKEELRVPARYEVYYLSLADKDIIDTLCSVVVAEKALSLARDGTKWEQINAILKELYELGFRVKFVTDSFIILEYDILEYNKHLLKRLALEKGKDIGGLMREIFTDLEKDKER